MVKVWYQPPPHGPRTALNRPSYGITGDVGPRWVVQLSKMPPGRVICGFIAGFACVAYIPLSEFFHWKFGAVPSIVFTCILRTSHREFYDWEYFFRWYKCNDKHSATLSYISSSTHVTQYFYSIFRCCHSTVGQKLPYTLSPEYLAAQRAYMRYHNMNPIWGISSKEARDTDGH